MSFAQQRLWFLEQLGENGPIYHVSLTRRLTGALDVEALGQAINDVIDRHEALRTVFPSEEGIPRQVVLDRMHIDIQTPDLSSVPSAERAPELRRQLDDDLRRRFDLSRGPLLRAKIWKLTENEHALLLVMHHIISDGWSMTVLSRELSEFYRRRTGGAAASLPPLPLQYPAYAKWQREYLQGEAGAEQLAYWKQQLADAPVDVQIPSDRPRPAQPQFAGAQEPFTVAAPLAEAVRALSRRCGATPFMVYLAALKCLLYRYTGEQDLMVGFPIAGRTREDIEHLIGFFVNTLVLRTTFSGTPTFRDFIKRVRNVALDAYSHQDLPFDRLVEEFQNSREAGGNPFFQIMFSFNNTGHEPLQLPGIVPESIETALNDAKFDVMFHVNDDGSKLHGKVSYRTDIFEGSTIRRMVGHYMRLLHGAVADPDCTIDRLPMITEQESTQLIREWNTTASDYPRDTAVHRLFEAQARRTPDSPAVAFGDSTLSYGEVNRRSNQLAHELRARGVGPEVLAGVLMERSPQMIVALLAVLKAGGAYVPLDTAYPEERLAFMVRDSRAAVVLTEPALAKTAQACSGDVPLAVLGAEDFSGNPDSDLDSDSGAESLAYVMYTSGSTGIPKGVAVTHRGIARLVINTNYVDLKSSDVVSQISNCSFDAATFEIWGALLNGACLRILGKEVALSPADLAREIERRGITVMFVTTALFHLIAQEIPSAFQRLRYLVVGGEAMQSRAAFEVLRAGAPAHLINGYGPTETTTFATFHAVESVPEVDRRIPIGRPISNSTAYILDRSRQPVPIGITGEIYLGGDGVARGYWGRPEETSERFLPDPFGALTGATLYRTGDLARYLPDGTIEFLGRNDHQVKIRGFRIETGEIESALAAHPDLQGAAVLARRNGSVGDLTLVAYVVSKSAPGPGPDDLRSFLKRNLPDFMIPAAFVQLDRFPLNPNGKLDRAALPAPESAPEQDPRKPARRLDKTQEQLADIWKSLLKRHKMISPTDSFFEIGGHSLLAVRLVSAVEKQFGAKLSLPEVFRGPTLEQMSAAIRRQTGSASSDILVPLQPEGSLTPFFWVHGDFSNGVFARSFDSDQPVYALLHQCHDGRPARFTEVRNIAAHYLGLVRTVQPEGPYLLGGYSFGGLVAFEMACQLKSSGEEVALLGLLEPTPPRGTPLVIRYRKDETPLRRRVDTVKKLGLSAGLSYVGSGITAKLSDCRNRLSRYWKRGKIAIFLAAGRPLTPELQSPYLLRLYSKAAKRYIPAGPYDGTVLMVAGDYGREYYDRSWGKFLRGNVEMVLFAGAHMDLVRGTTVSEIAACFKTRIRQAQEGRAAAQV